MIEDYTPELKGLMSKAELKKLTNHIGTMAEKDYRSQLEMTEVDPMSEMTAREYTEEMMKSMLYRKLSELQPEAEDEESYSDEEIELFKEYIESLNN